MIVDQRIDAVLQILHPDLNKEADYDHFLFSG